MRVSLIFEIIGTIININAQNARKWKDRCKRFWNFGLNIFNTCKFSIEDTKY